MKGTDERAEAKVAALHALGLLPKGGLTKIQWKIMRALRSDGKLSPHFVAHMRAEHRFFDSISLVSLAQRNLIAYDPYARGQDPGITITPDGLILMRHLEIEARRQHWERRYR